MSKLDCQLGTDFIYPQGLQNFPRLKCCKIIESVKEIHVCSLCVSEAFRMIFCFHSNSSVCNMTVSIICVSQHYRVFRVCCVVIFCLTADRTRCTRDVRLTGLQSCSSKVYRLHTFQVLIEKWEVFFNVTCL